MSSWLDGNVAVDRDRASGRDCLYVDGRRRGRGTGWRKLAKGGVAWRRSRLRNVYEPLSRVSRPDSHRRPAACTSSRLYKAHGFDSMTRRVRPSATTLAGRPHWSCTSSSTTPGGPLRGYPQGPSSGSSSGARSSKPGGTTRWALMRKGPPWSGGRRDVGWHEHVHAHAALQHYPVHCDISHRRSADGLIAHRVG